MIADYTAIDGVDLTIKIRCGTLDLIDTGDGLGYIVYRVFTIRLCSRDLKILICGDIVDIYSLWRTAIGTKYKVYEIIITI